MASILEEYGLHEWLCKTNFSFLIGASHPHDIVKTASDLQYSSICVNDFDGVYGLARTYRELERLKRDDENNNLKLNFGAEIHFSVDHDKPILLQDTLVLVAKDWEGYKNLCELLTYSHRDGKTYANIPLNYLLSADVSGLFAIQPMRGLIRSNIEKESFYDLHSHFKGGFYFAISKHFHRSEDRWIRPTIDIAGKIGAKCLLSQDVFFHNRFQKPMSDLLHAIKTNKTLNTCKEHLFPNGERCFHDTENFERFFCDLPVFEEGIILSHELNEQCSFSFSQLRYKYPKEMIPDGYTAQSYLEQLVWQGARRRFGNNISERVRKSLTHELDLVEKLNFADYFLTVWDIVSWARSKNILCQGRGSAANSAVCFVLGITEVNPDLFDLLFERFISMERGDPPDIDVDFEHERREEVVQYIYDRYGRDRAAMVANVITFRAKGAMRAVGKALGASEELLGEMSKLADYKYFLQSGTRDIISELNKGENSNNTPKNFSWKLWVELSERLRGFPRHLGIHSGGFILTDKPLNYLIPQEPASMEGRTVVQWCKDDIEGLGFFKIDILCLGMLTAIRKCFESIEEKYGRKLTLYSIPENDPATYEMIQMADTVGTFQIESRAQMSMLPRLKPRCFYDLVIEVGIIRPGPIQGKIIHPYLARREGKAPVIYPDERMRPILSRTLGVPIFQEQAMRIAIDVGDFTPGEANELRKNIGSWNVREFKMDLNPWLEKLKRGMEKNGIKKEFIDQILRQMKGFAHYGFPESHAVSFALLAYASSYLKCHYPAAFFNAVLNSQPMGFYLPHALLQAAQRNGITILPISINESDWDNKLENISSENREPIYGIRLGFRLVNSLSKSGCQDMLRVRKDIGRWEGLDHFLKTTQVYRDDFTALAAANAFEEFGISRSEAIWKAEAAPFRRLIDEEDRKIDWNRETKMQQIQRDFHSFNTSLEEHPVKILKRDHWPYRIPVKILVPAKDLASKRRNSIVLTFGMTLVKQSPGSAKGMVFITLEDETGFINLVFTPNVYSKYYHIVERQPFLCVEGQLQKASDYHSILVRKIFEPDTNQNVVKIERKEERYENVESSMTKLVKPRSFM
jgi:error-prone DNA polymerase